MNPGNYAAIILAAGFSSRMQDFKPLLTLGGETITDRVISTFLSHDIDVILVTGWRHEELISGIKHRDIVIVKNTDFEKGMLSSIQTGVSHLQSRHSSFFIMPVDIPLVRPSTIKRLIDNAVRFPGKIIYPVIDSRRGHPPLIPSSLITEITGWTGNGGLDVILESHRELDMEVLVPDENILLDTDEKEDYARLLERFGRYEIPAEKESRAMLDITGTPENAREHCRKVAEVATVIAEAVISAGHMVDIPVVRAAAALHDIAKLHPEHDIEGGNILRNFGFERVGDIVSLHSDIYRQGTAVSLEARIVYIADKFVRDVEPVSIKERYDCSALKYGSIPGVLEKIVRYRNDSLKIKEELETILGYSLDTLIFGE